MMPSAAVVLSVSVVLLTRAPFCTVILCYLCDLSLGCSC